MLNYQLCFYFKEFNDARLVSVQYLRVLLSL